MSQPACCDINNSDSDIECVFDGSQSNPNAKQSSSSDSVEIILVSDSESPIPVPEDAKILPVDDVERRILCSAATEVCVSPTVQRSEQESRELWMELFLSANKTPKSSVLNKSFESPLPADIAISLDDDFEYNNLFLDNSVNGSEECVEHPADRVPGGFCPIPKIDLGTPPDSYPSEQQDEDAMEPAPSKNSVQSVSNDLLINVRTESLESLVSTRTTDDDACNVVKKRRKKYSKLSEEEKQRVLDGQDEKKRQKLAEREAKRLEKEKLARERKEKKIVKETEKLERKALREAYHPIQGGKQSLTHLCVHIPSTMLDAVGREEMLTCFTEDSDGFVFQECDVNAESACVIYWTREHVTAAIERNSHTVVMNKTKETLHEKYVLIQVPKMLFVAMVDFHKQAETGEIPPNRESFNSYIRKWKSEYPDYSLHFFVYGLEKYFRNQLNDKIYGENKPARQKPARRSILEIPYEITYEDLENATLDLMCRHQIQIKQIESPKELARHLVTMHKAVADRHAKQFKSREALFFDAFSANTKTKGVTVRDDSLDGYRELWIRQLEQFSLVSRDVAITIANLYPSPRILMKAYDSCTSEDDKERLLENVIVRRGTERRLGPKMSRLLYRFTCSTDGDEILE